MPIQNSPWQSQIQPITQLNTKQKLQEYKHYRQVLQLNWVLNILTNFCFSQLISEGIKFLIRLFKVKVILKLESVLGLATSTSLLLPRAWWPVKTTTWGSTPTSSTPHSTTVHPTTTPWCLLLLVVLLLLLVLLLLWSPLRKRSLTMENLT